MKASLFFILLCMVTSASLSQSPNPFDIAPPTQPTTQPNSPPHTSPPIEPPPPFDTANPFELLSSTTIHRLTADDTKKADNPFVTPPSLTLRSAKKFIDTEPVFWLSLISLFLFAILHNLKRQLLPMLFRGLLNPNLVHHIASSSRFQMGFLFYLYHFFALIQISVFLFLMANWWGLVQDLTALLLLIVLLTAAVYFYQLLLLGIGYLYNLSKRARNYVLHLRLYEIVLGIALAPINFLTTLLPPSVAHWIIILGLGMIALYGLLRLSRLLIIAQPWRVAYTFYFILYFCTFEISPLLLLGRGLSYIGIQWT